MYHQIIFFSDGTPARPSAVSTPTVSGPDRIEKIEHPGVSALKKPFVRQVTSPGLSETPLSTSRFSKHYKTVILKRSNSIEIGTSQVKNVKKFANWEDFFCDQIKFSVKSFEVGLPDFITL